jgi:hypothetical protein
VFKIMALIQNNHLYSNLEAAKAAMEQIYGQNDITRKSRMLRLDKMLKTCSLKARLVVETNAKRKLSQLKRTLDDRHDLFSCPAKLPYRKFNEFS